MPKRPYSYRYRVLELSSDYTETEKYRSSGRGPDFKVFPRDRKQHKENLARQLEQVQADFQTLKNQRHAAGITGNEGITVVFRSEPDYELKHESLDLKSQGIELLNVQTYESINYATVFIPEGRLSVFFKRLEGYAAESPKHVKLLANIAEIRKATVEALWTDEQNLFPAEQDSIWWEVWLRDLTSNIDALSFFRENAPHFGLQAGSASLRFPDRTVLLAYGTRNQIAESVDLLSCIAELRRAKESPSVFLNMPRREQQEWADDVLRRLDYTNRGDISVLVLDTGINNAHPLIAPFLTDTDLHKYNQQWLSTDENGHGTGMAGFSLYGDLFEALSSTEPVQISHILESGKIIRDGGHEHPPELFGAVTSQVVSMAEIQAPERKRIISLAVSTDDYRDRGRPSSWSSSLDALASGYGEEGEQRRLVIVCAGNVSTEDRIHYPESNKTEGVHDPAQSWNALCVGSYTQKIDINRNVYPNLVPIAEAGNISPASTTTLVWDRQWPLKPDIVLEGGNWALNDGSPVGGDPDEIRLLTTSNDTARNLFATSGDTSAATSQAARMAAIIQSEYPHFWPETVRALMVQSAEWTPAMLRQFEMDPFTMPTRKSNVQNLIRYCGFGIPDTTRALRCAENDLTLVIESTLYPYAREGSSNPSMRDMNLHTIPWPAEVLRDLGNTPVQMRVTLSYFIEPNPGERGWKRRHSYQSHGLRFDVNLPQETKDGFRMFLNNAVREEEENPRVITQRDGDRWVVGKDNRHKGSLHSDIWHGTAIELAERRYIGVYPVVGWWRDNTRHRCWDKLARYALVVSVSTPAEEVSLYTEIANRIGIPIQI